jgi:hypothetical protein
MSPWVKPNQQNLQTHRKKHVYTIQLIILTSLFTSLCSKASAGSLATYNCKKISNIYFLVYVWFLHSICMSKKDSPFQQQRAAQGQMAILLQHPEGSTLGFRISDMKNILFLSLHITSVKLHFTLSLSTSQTFIHKPHTSGGVRQFQDIMSSKKEYSTSRIFPPIVYWGLMQATSFQFASVLHKDKLYKQWENHLV